MSEKVLKKIFMGFMSMHVLYHASKAPLFGAWMLEELAHHGYKVSAGTLYPLLHELHNEGLLAVEDKNVGGKIRKYYSITEAGLHVLEEARIKLKELTQEAKHESK